MAFTFGSGSGVYSLGPCGESHCSNCNAVRPFDMLFYYEYWTLNYLGMIRRKYYCKHCQTCGIGTVLADEDVDPYFKPIRFPFRLQYGWVIWLVVIVACSLLVAYIQAIKPR